MSNTNLTKNRQGIQAFRRSKQFLVAPVVFPLLLVLGRGRGKKDFDKQKIYVVICDTDIL